MRDWRALSLGAKKYIVQTSSVVHVYFFEISSSMSITLFQWVHPLSNDIFTLKKISIIIGFRYKEIVVSKKWVGPQ